MADEETDIADNRPDRRERLTALAETLPRTRRVRAGWLRDGTLLQSWLGVRPSEALVLGLDFARPPAADHTGVFADPLDADVADLVLESRWLHGALERADFAKQAYPVPNPLTVPDSVWTALGWKPDEVLVEWAIPLRRRAHPADGKYTFAAGPKRVDWFVRSRLMHRDASDRVAAPPPGVNKH